MLDQSDIHPLNETDQVDDDFGGGYCRCFIQDDERLSRSDLMSIIFDITEEKLCLSIALKTLSGPRN